MSNTYDMLLNPPPHKQMKSAENKIDPGSQANPQTSKLEKKQRSRVINPPASPIQNKNQSIHELVNQPINPLINQRTSRLMNKPTGFYISEQLDLRLDQAVDYYRRKHGLKKVDRSIVINALLEQDELWDESSLDQLVERIIGVLTRRLMG